MTKGYFTKFTKNANNMAPKKQNLKTKIIKYHNFKTNSKKKKEFV
jgi:hypothetical protein